jgi:hypothetical protein
MRMRLWGVGLAMGAYACCATVAAAAHPMIPVTTHMGRGITPTNLVIEPDGTAYVQGESLSKEVVVPEVYAYSPAGALLRKLAIPAGTALEAYGNGQLYVGGEMSEHIYGVSPQSGAKVSEVGAQDEGFPGNLGIARGLGVGPGGTIYESGGELTVPEPSDPDSVMSIYPIETFTSSGAYSGYIEPKTETGLLAVSPGGDIFGSWTSSNGTGMQGVLSPQGAVLTQFSVFTPHPEVHGGTFSADGSSIYAGVVLHHGAGGSTFVARLSLSGKVLEKFGSIPIHDAANFWEYDTAAVAANGDGWTTRAVPGKLYRFHA